MSLDFYRKLNYVFGLIALGVLFGLVIFAANLEIKDLDLWLHIKVGQVIAETGTVPSQDILSCTIAGRPWVNHEWLFQLLVYSIYSLWGPNGLITMQVAVVALTFSLLLFLGYNKDRQLLITFLLLLVMMVYRMRFTIRPDLFSLLFFSLYIYILAFFLDRRWSGLAVFIVQALWVNMHGFSFIGPFLVLVAIVSEYLKRRLRLPWQWNESGRLDDEEYRRLHFIFVISILASLFNPLFLKGAWYPIGVLLQLAGESKIFFKHIVELQPPVEWSTMLSASRYPFYKLLIVLSGVSFIFNRRRIDIGDLVVWGMFLYASLAAVRNISFFAFAAYLVCLTNMSNVRLEDVLPFQISDKKFLYLLGIGLKIFLIFWMINSGLALSQRGYYDFDKHEFKSEYGGVAQRNFPDKAADFLVENKVRGNFFNDFNSGAYLVGRCFPDIKVFIDGRTEVYGPEFFNYYQKIWAEADPDVLAEAVETYGLTGIFLNSVNKEIPDKLLQYLRDRDEWVLVYLNYDGVIYLKDVPINKEVIRAHRVDVGGWEVRDFDLMKLGTKTVTPYRHINRAYTLGALGNEDAARREVEEALKVAPCYAEPYKILGKIHGSQNDHRKAFEYYRIASSLSQHDTETRANLGLAYEHLGDVDGAIRQFKIMIRQSPQNARGYFLMAKAHAKKRQYEVAMQFLETALEKDPKAVKDILKVGDIVFDDKEYEKARDIYTLASKRGKHEAMVHLKLAETFEALGEREQAVQHYKKVLEEDPENEVAEAKLETLPSGP